MFFERATEHAASDLCRSITTIVDAIRMGRLEVEVENKTHGRKRIRLVRYDDE